MTEERLPRKLAAVLYADVAGYSRLMGSDEDRTHKILRDYLDLIAREVEGHRGETMHYAGDAVLVKFDAAIDAVSCATGIQKQLGTRNADLETATPKNRKPGQPDNPRRQCPITVPSNF